MLYYCSVYYCRLAYSTNVCMYIVGVEEISYAKFIFSQFTEI